MKKFVLYSLMLVSFGLAGCSPDSQTGATEGARKAPAKAMAPMPGAVPFEREVLTVPDSGADAQPAEAGSDKAAGKP